MTLLRAATANMLWLARTAAVLVDRDVEHVDGGVVDVEIEHVLQAPAHRGLEFLGRHVGRVDREHLVFAAAEHGQAAVIVGLQFAADLFERVGAGRRAGRNG